MVFEHLELDAEAVALLKEWGACINAIDADLSKKLGVAPSPFGDDPKFIIKWALREAIRKAHEAGYAPAPAAERGPAELGTPISELSGRPGHAGFEKFKEIAASWGHD